MLRVGGAEPIFRDFSNRTKMKTKYICNQGITKQKGRYWYMAGRKNAKNYFKNPFHRPTDKAKFRCVYENRAPDIDNDI